MYQLEDLEAWKKAGEFRIQISKTCNQFPKEEKFRLIDQLIRASRSIPDNIAEGHGRFHYQETFNIADKQEVRCSNAKSIRIVLWMKDSFRASNLRNSPYVLKNC